MPRTATRTALLLAVLWAAAPAAESAPLALAEGRGAPVLDLPAGWRAVAKEGRWTILPDGAAPHIQCWRLAAGDLAQAEDGAAAAVVDEVRGFAIAERQDLHIGGRPARRLIGTGEEADDGDPSRAEVVLFSAGGATWLLIAHGEGDGAARFRERLAALLATLHAS